MNFKVGQISNRFDKYSKNLDYLQLDICGIKAIDISNKIENILEKNNQIKEVLLHSDWTKKGCSENNFPHRLYEYIEIKEILKKYVKVSGITLHPMFRNKIKVEDFIDKVNVLNKHINVFIENRSNSRILFSKPNEIIELSQNMNMTLDIPQLFISCNYNKDEYTKTLDSINWDNIKEIHLANIQKKDKNTFVGRQLDDGILDIDILNKRITDQYITLEILGGSNIFDKNKVYLNNIF